MAGLMAKIQEISKKRKAGFRRLDESEEDNENMLVQTYSDEEIEDLDALKESAEDVGGYVKEVQDEDGETEYEVCVPHLEAKNFENIATEKGAFKTDEEDDETLEEKAKSKKRKARFNEEDDILKDDISDEEDDENLEECGLSEFRKQNVFTKIANRPVDEAEYTKEEYQAMADELRRVADDLEDGDFDDTSRLQAIRDLMPNVGKLRAGISVNEEEEDGEPLEEADDNDFKDFKRKNLKAAKGRVLDFQKEKISTIQDYIDDNWDDIMDIMKSGELRQVFGLNIEENKKFDSTKLYLGSADKKTQSNIVRRATNFARKNPGLFVSLSFNFLTFGVLKNDSVVETIKPLMQDYLKAGYAEYISITDKRLSKVLKK